MTPVYKIALLNRGEPAMRFLRAAREYTAAYGTPLQVVAFYTTPDAEAPFVRYADEAVNLGPAQQPGPDGALTSAYVRVEEVITAIREAGCDAVWPGWGFVSEDPHFVERLEQEGIEFLGPPSSAIHALGDKLASKRLADEAGVPMAPWGEVSTEMSERELTELGLQIGFPLMVKASAGGGGRGIRRVASPEELSGAVAGVQLEVDKIFGSGGVFLEKCISGARHIEVQLVVNAQGQAYTLGVRDCSLQRRSQKVIEEAPSPILPAEVEHRLRTSAADLAVMAGYRGVGTAEFLYDPSTGESAFLEVNSRLQVEHTITECLYGVDLVHAQIDIALGRPWHVDDRPPNGWAIEARLNAENAERGFSPAPGKIVAYRPPSGPGIRVDSGVEANMTIAPDFDSMIAKVIAWGPTRDLAIARLKRALKEFEVLVQDGTTNKAFLLEILAHPQFCEGRADTRWLDRATASGELANPDRSVEALLLAAVQTYRNEHIERASKFFRQVHHGVPQDIATPKGLSLELKLRGEKVPLDVYAIGHQHYLIHSGEHVHLVRVEKSGPNAMLLEHQGHRHRALLHEGRAGIAIEIDGVLHHVERSSGGVICAPAPAMVAHVAVEAGQVLAAGDPVCTVEAMKMETVLYAEDAGTVQQVLCRPNMQVQAGQPLLVLAVDEEEARAPASLPAEGPHRLSHVQYDRPEALGECLRSIFLGYELPSCLAGTLVRSLQELRKQGPRQDLSYGALFDALTAFVEIERLFDRAFLIEQNITRAESPEMAFFAFCRDHHNEPETPLGHALTAAMARYGVHSLEPSTKLRNGLWRAVAASRHPAQRVRLATELCRTLIALHHAGIEAPTSLRPVLESMALLAGATSPGLSDVARQASYTFFERPRYLTGRTDALEALSELGPVPSPALQMIQRTSFDLMAPLLELSSSKPGAALLGLLARMFPTQWTERIEINGATAIATTQSGTLFAGVSSAQEAPALMKTFPEVTEPVLLQWFTRGVPAAAPSLPALPEGSRAVETWHDGVLHHRTWVRRGTWQPEDQPEIHPDVFRRLSLHRYEAFNLSPIPVSEHVHAFLAVAKSDPKDERVLLFTEIFEAPETLDDQTGDTALLGFERQWFEALTTLRSLQSQRGRRTRLHWNRLTILMRTQLATTTEGLAKVATRLEPHTRGLGLESVVVETLNAEGRGLRFTISRPDRRQIRVNAGPLEHNKVTPAGPYERKVRRCRRLGLSYPYEMIRWLQGDTSRRRLAHPDLLEGQFEEWDLTPEGGFAPVDRAPGGNQAGVVVGLITHKTSKHPAGMTRVWIASDPTSSMGALAQPECERICAALELAAQRGLPVEWVALSAGAKIAMDSGTENLDWTARVLKSIIGFTQDGGEIHLIVPGVNVGAQSYWNAEATMMMHTKGVLIMTADGSMVLTGKKALEISGGVAAEDEKGIGGFERVMGPNGQAQYFATDLVDAYRVLMTHYEVGYRIRGQLSAHRPTVDPVERDICGAPYTGPVEDGFSTLGELFDPATNPGRKKPFSIRALMGGVIDQDAPALERFQTQLDAETAVVWETHLGGHGVTLIGIESRPIHRTGTVPLDGPDIWAGGTLFPSSSRKVARAINAASGSRPVVVLANLSGFDGSPESMRKLQLLWGAEIGRAVVNFEGPVVFVVVGRYHGGAYVVFSKALNPSLTALAVKGSYASVIGGAPAAAVVFPRDVRKRVAADPRVKALKQSIQASTGEERARLHAQHRTLVEELTLEKRGEVATEFDAIHSVERAVRVGSLDAVIEAHTLRPSIIRVLRGQSPTASDVQSSSVASSASDPVLRT